MYRATKEFKRDMAHRLPTHEWKCWNVHWHTYKALITIQWEHLQEEWPETGMLKDFWNFQPIKEWRDKNRDHAYVWRSDDIVIQLLWKEWWRTYSMLDNPTAENMAKLLYEKCKELLEWVNIDKVIIYETPTSFAEYSLRWGLNF